jgi:predicted RNase H-like nuclease
MLVAGVDGCRNAWIVAIVRAEGLLTLESLTVVPDFDAILSLTRDCTHVGIDVPIGLADYYPRLPDVAARKQLGSLRSSVFPVPIRAVLGCADYVAACDLQESLWGRRISTQMYRGILPKIREVDTRMTPFLQHRVFEVHPEVCFWAMNGAHPLEASKHTLQGIEMRRALLAKHYDEDVGLRPLPRPATRDDALDACAVAWTAYRKAQGLSRTLPEHPDVDARGLRMEIVY